MSSPDFRADAAQVRQSTQTVSPVRPPQSAPHHFENVLSLVAMVPTLEEKGILFRLITAKRPRGEGAVAGLLRGPPCEVTRPISRI